MFSLVENVKKEEVAVIYVVFYCFIMKYIKYTELCDHWKAITIYKKTRILSVFDF